MTKVRILKALGGYAADTEIETTPRAAEQLIANGYADEVKNKGGRPKKADTDTPTDTSEGTQGGHS